MKTLTLELELLNPLNYEKLAFVHKSQGSIYDIINPTQLKVKDRPILNYDTGSEEKIEGINILKKLEDFEIAPYFTSSDIRHLGWPIKITSPSNIVETYRVIAKGLHAADRDHPKTRAILFYKILNLRGTLFNVLKQMSISTLQSHSSVMYLKKSNLDKEVVGTFKDMFSEL